MIPSIPENVNREDKKMKRKFDIYDAIQQTMFIQNCGWAEACKQMMKFITENPTYCTQLDCHTQRTAKEVMVVA